ncbi:hypothetical protein JCM1393_16970 [Clostridium carnis]
MRKVLIYISVVIVSASIPIYTLLFWEPLKDNDIKEEFSKIEIIKEVNEKNKNSIAVINESKGIIENSKEEIVQVLNEVDKFKINFEEITREITKEERIKINNLLNKLSAVDIIKVNDLFKNGENKNAIKEGMLLLKKRMSSNDYEEFKEILSKYLKFKEIDIEI